MTHQQYRAAVIERDQQSRCPRCGHFEKEAKQLREELAKTTRHCQFLERQIAYVRANASTDEKIHEIRPETGLYDGWSEWHDEIKDDTSRKTRHAVWNEPSWEDIMKPKPRQSHSGKDDTLSEDDGERKEQMDKIMSLRKTLYKDDRKVPTPHEEDKARTHAATSYQYKEKTVREKSQRAVQEDRPSTHRSLDAPDAIHDTVHNVAALGEHYKQDRVAEMYSEIYDNQWIETFQFMKEFKPKESDNAQTLVKILITCYDMCAEVSEEQLKVIEEASHFPRSKWTTQEMKTLYLKQVSTPAPITRITHEYLRAIAKYCIPFIQHTFRVKKLPGIQELRHQGKRIEGDVLTEFVNKCVEVTWYMNIQDPPMAFLVDVEHGSTFDKNYFRFYSSRGNTMDFVVWPTLLLHDDGQVCTKGVAQPVPAV